MSFEGFWACAELPRFGKLGGPGVLTGAGAAFFGKKNYRLFCIRIISSLERRWGPAALRLPICSSSK
jgi:hypothetical protein